MSLNDIQSSIDYLSSWLFGEESEHFEKVRERLEGYDLAYSVILDENERLEKELEKLKTESDLFKELSKNIEKSAIDEINHLKSLLKHADSYSTEMEDERKFWNEVCDYMEQHKCTKKEATSRVGEKWEGLAEF